MGCKGLLLYSCCLIIVTAGLAFPAEVEYDKIPFPQNLESEDLPTLEELEDEKLEKMGRILEEILIMPWPKGESPLLYVENLSDGQTNELTVNENYPTTVKRARYYRKYPWKRQNSRYDAENRYLCQPSKDDVFRLLVALHEARQGNRGKSVSFCNRKRPAGTIFTNIRFLGK